MPLRLYSCMLRTNQKYFFILMNIIDLFYCALCLLGSHCLFSIGSYDERSSLKHSLRKNQPEVWKQGNGMT